MCASYDGFEGNTDIINGSSARKTIGLNILSFKTVDSTNSIARNYADSGADDGTVVTAEIQNKGKGRLKRAWFSPKGGLWLSIILRPELDPKDAGKLTLMAGCAVAQTLSKFHVDARLKWPNDVLVSGKKICGILTEMRTQEDNIQYLILGIGINLNFYLEDLPEDIREHSTTLRHETDKSIDPRELMSILLGEVDGLYHTLKAGDSNKILNIWKDKSDTLGRRVRILTQQEDIEGTAEDVDDSGALILRTDDNEIKKIIAGDCIHVTSTG
jgi:BirA family biotin operon repressor/biotin-[acetyl-CoA-carboxylase] ligase